MKRITFSQPAPDGCVYGPNAFATAPGSQVPFTDETTGEHVLAEIVAVEVLDDGHRLLVTLDIPSETAFAAMVADVEEADAKTYSLDTPTENAR